MRPEPTNQEIARKLIRVADLLEAQDASPSRVSAWRDGAAAVAGEPGRVADAFAAGGFAALDAIPHVGRGLAGAIAEILKTGRARILDRLEGEGATVDLIAELPGVGPVLARRIHRQLGIDSLEELEEAAHDGRLLGVAGFGERRVRAVSDLLAARLGMPGRERGAPPPVAQILDVDRRYRRLASAGALRGIAPRHPGPGGDAGLPILHVELDGWQLTALFSDTPLAHQLGKARDWVAVFHERDGVDGRSTVITETQGPLAGRRVVRGRERETASTIAAERAAAQGADVARM